MKALTRLLLFVVGLGLAGFGLKNGVDAIQAGLQGIETTARVVELKQVGESYRVSYEFTVNGQRYTGEQEIPRDQYTRLQPGGPIQVRYSSGSPLLSRPVQAVDALPIVVPGVGGVSLIALDYLLIRRGRIAQQRAKRQQAKRRDQDTGS